MKLTTRVRSHWYAMTTKSIMSVAWRPRLNPAGYGWLSTAVCVGRASGEHPAAVCVGMLDATTRVSRSRNDVRNCAMR